MNSPRGKIIHGIRQNPSSNPNPDSPTSSAGFNTTHASQDDEASVDHHIIHYQKDQPDEEEYGDQPAGFNMEFSFLYILKYNKTIFVF